MFSVLLAMPSSIRLSGDQQVISGMNLLWISHFMCLLVSRSFAMTYVTE